MRKLKPDKRVITPDPIYRSVLITQFICQIMQQGRKNLAQKIAYQTLDNLEKKKKMPALEIFTKAVENIKPLLELRSRKVGGARYQIPIKVSSARQITLALRWLVESAKNRSEKSMTECLSEEILQAFKKEGNAFKKKENIHRMAEANRAFAYYSW